MQQQMRRRVVLPVTENLAGLGQGHCVDHAVGVAAAGGEGAVEGAELLAGIAPAVAAALATGPASPGASSLGCSPAICKIAATAALSSDRLAAQSLAVFQGKERWQVWKRRL